MPLEVERTVIAARLLMKPISVMKFGGTSVGSAEAIARTAEILAGACRIGPVVGVVSAMSGVTNLLIHAARRAEHGEEVAIGEVSAKLRERHSAVIDALVKDQRWRVQLTVEIDLLISEVANLCRGTALLHELTPRAFDSICGAGERFSARLVAAALAELGMSSLAVEATELIVTEDEYNGAEYRVEQTAAKSRARLLPLLEQSIVPVVTGYIGANEEGVLTTLGRGGSDYSATILGAALDAGEVVIWTDVDGVMSADPRLVQGARLLREISYNEAAEMAHFGAKVLHPKTLRPVAELAIPVWIRNSSKPNETGTKITPAGHPTASGIKAIAAIENVSLVTVGGRGIVGVVGMAAKTFTAVAEAKANVLLISQSSSENDICFILMKTEADKAVKAMRRAFADSLRHHLVERIVVRHDVAIVAVIGERMHGAPGLAGRIFQTIGAAEVNVIAIAQGSSEYNVSFVIESASVSRAMNALHDEFGLASRSDETT
jgi:aspartokinase/homoserine dehydrogenase 1